MLIYVLNSEQKYVGLAPVIEDDVLSAAIFPELKMPLKEVFV